MQVFENTGNTDFNDYDNIQEIPDIVKTCSYKNSCEARLFLATSASRYNE